MASLDAEFLLAARHETPAVLRGLAARGADVDALTPSGGEAFSEALAGDRYENLAVIHELGHRARDHAGAALRSAVGTGDEQAVGILLGLGADPDYADPDSVYPWGPGALGVAARYGELDMVRALVEAGATVDQEEAEGMRPYLIAVERGRVEMAEYLREFEPWDQHDPEVVAERIAEYRLPQTLRGFLSAADPLLRAPRGAAVRWITFFTLADAVPFEVNGRRVLRLSRAVDGYETQILWDRDEGRVIARDTSCGESLAILGTWPQFFADPFKLLARYYEGEFDAG